MTTLYYILFDSTEVGIIAENCCRDRCVLLFVFLLLVIT